MKTFILKIAIVIVVFVTAIWLIGFLNQDSPSLPLSSFRLSPYEESISVGQEFKVDIILKTDQEINGADSIISFDSRLLEVIDIQPGNLFPFYPRKNINLEKDRIEITGVKSKKDGQVFTQPLIFATIVFKGKTPGIAKVDFTFYKGKTIGSTIVKAEGSENILEKVYNGKYEIK